MIKHHRSSPYEPDPKDVPAREAKHKLGTGTVPGVAPKKKVSVKEKK